MGAGHHQQSPGSSPWHGLRPVVAVAFCMVLSGTGLLRQVGGLPLYAIAAVVGGLPLLWTALLELWRWRLSADLAVCVAAGAALAIGQHFVAAEVILIMLVGGVLEELAVGRTRSAIGALVRLLPHDATRLTAGRRERLPVAALRPGDVVAVAAGERLAVDGAVVAGRSTVDQSALTGESLPIDVDSGSRVLAGSLNGDGPLEVLAERVGANTAFGRMVHLVEEAEHSKAPVQRLADRYASYFLPLVLACAGGVYLWSGDVVRAVAVLVVACPCALVLATPTAITAGIGRLARRGILVKGGGPLEALGRSRALLLDKTGTLTLARLRVADILPAAGRCVDEVLYQAAALEQLSEHPLGRAIAAAGLRLGRDFPAVSAVEVRPGQGICGSVADLRVSVGSLAFLETLGIRLPAPARERATALQAEGHSVVGVALGNEYAGLIAAADDVRPEALDAVARLNELYQGRLCMLTGDAEGPARRLGELLGIRDVRSQLLPEGKTRVVAEFRQGGTVVAMLGDGINDAPALAAADVGLAVTDVGTDVAVDAAGISLHGERHLDRLAEAVVFSRRVVRTIRQNLILFAVGTNALAVVAAGSGLAGPVAAALLHQVSSLLVVGNSLRLLWDRADVADGWQRLLRRCRAAAWRLWRPALAALGAAYALSGLYAVRPGELGVVRWFGRSAAPTAPGLHYRLPWPATRLDRVQMERVERLEVGFRTHPVAGQVVASYEWNTQHRDGRYRTVPEESLITCGDQRFLEVNVVVHYRPAEPLRYLFAAADRPALLQAAAQGAIAAVLGHRDVQTVLTAARSAVEDEIAAALRSALAGLDPGVAVTGVHLQDVHPPLEVVDAYRLVVDALEEKDALANRAEAYAFEQVPLARGRATALRCEAAGGKAEALSRATGEAAAFTARVQARGEAAERREVVDFRLYVEALEQALEGRRLVLLDGAVPQRTGLTLLPPGTLLSPATGATLEEAVQEGPRDEIPRARPPPASEAGPR